MIRVRRRPVAAVVKGLAVSDTRRSTPDEPEQPAGAAQTHTFASHVQEGVHVITFSRPDVLDAEYIEQLGDDIYRHLKTVDAPRVVIDLHGARQLSSAALGMFIALKKVIEKRGGRICIANVHRELLEVFKITELHKLLAIHDSTDEAVRNLA